MSYNLRQLRGAFAAGKAAAERATASSTLLDCEICGRTSDRDRTWLVWFEGGPEMSASNPRVLCHDHQRSLPQHEANRTRTLDPRCRGNLIDLLVDYSWPDVVARRKLVAIYAALGDA